MASCLSFSGESSYASKENLAAERARWALEMRQSIKQLDPDLKISINDIIIKVAAAALSQHPQVNASFQDKTVRFYEHADIGVAVATENGLITPVVRAADLKSLLEIAAVDLVNLAQGTADHARRPEHRGQPRGHGRSR